MSTPDYQRIAQLERELGIGQPEPEPERAAYPNPLVCLIKGCDGESTEVFTWAGVRLRTWHTHH